MDVVERWYLELEGEVEVKGSGYPFVHDMLDVYLWITYAPTALFQ